MRYFFNIQNHTKMSVVVKSLTPFLDLNTLLEAVKQCGYDLVPIEEGVRYEIPQLRFHHKACFVKDELGRFQFHYDTEVKAKARTFLKYLEEAYNGIVDRKLAAAEEDEGGGEPTDPEEIKIKEATMREAIRLQTQRQAYLKKQQEAIEERARAMGYKIQRKTKNGRTQLVLVKG